MNKTVYGLCTKKGISIPLTGVDVRGDITGRAARVKVTQRFHNSEDRALEVVYKFPLPDGGAICGFKAIIGERTINGQIEERQQAFKIYDEALANGDGAYLLDEERPNIFTLSLGNLNPGTSASVEIDYAVLLDTRDDEVRFLLPTTISPRYLPPDTEDVNGIPAEEYVNPPVSLDSHYGLNISLAVHGRDGVKSIESPSHTISTDFETDRMMVALSSDSTDMDRDFILNIRYKEDFETRGYLWQDDKESFIQLDFSPVKDTADSSKGGSTKREIIFVLDCSGSMNGRSINEAGRALSILVKALESGTAFNIYKFGSTYHKMWPESRSYDKESLDATLKYLSGISADLGGTEILAPLKDISANLVDGAATSVILITDGQVGNEDRIMELVKKRKGRMRMFPIGIGHGPNEYFVKQLARITGGACELISPGERIEPKLLRLFNKISDGACIDNLRIDWGASVTEAGSTSIAYCGETVSVFARLEGRPALPERIVVTGKKGRGYEEWAAGLSPVSGESLPLPVLWARERIREYEEGSLASTGSLQTGRKQSQVSDSIIEISMRYRVVSRETSFVAVEERSQDKKTVAEAVLRKVPVMLTEGWGGVRISAPVSHMHLVDRFSAECELSLANRSVLTFRCRPLAAYSIPRKELKEKKGIGVDLMDLLSLQRAEGGFDLDSTLVDMIHLPVFELHQMALNMQLTGGADRIVLLATAIVLQILEQKYANREDEWYSVVKKTRKWFDKEIKASSPAINGTSLTAWAGHFVKERVNISTE